jgi:epoxyqueuosine reductase
MEDYVLEHAGQYAASLGIMPPRFTRRGNDLVMISALPTGRGETARPSAENPVGSIAAFAQKNFYREMTRRLKGVLRLLEKDGFLPENSGCRIFCNSRLPEKELAVRAGLGARGKNGLVIIPGAGSLVVLGGIVFSEQGVRAARGSPAEKTGSGGEDFAGVCGNCAACLSACPTGAIRAPGRIDLGLCIQAYAARELPAPKKVRDAWGITLYGCGICQAACPHNAKPPPAAHTSHGVLGPSVPLEKILACADSELRKSLFRGTALDMSWISPLALKRGAIYAAARQKAEKLLPLLARYEQHPHILLRQAADWAAAHIRESH